MFPFDWFRVSRCISPISRSVVYIQYKTTRFYYYIFKYLFSFHIDQHEVLLCYKYKNFQFQSVYHLFITFWFQTKNAVDECMIQNTQNLKTPDIHLYSVSGAHFSHCEYTRVSAHPSNAHNGKTYEVRSQISLRTITPIRSSLCMCLRCILSWRLYKICYVAFVGPAMDASLCIWRSLIVIDVAIRCFGNFGMALNFGVLWVLGEVFDVRLALWYKFRGW